MDGLRAVAVLPVILFHAGFAAFEGGYVGVDVFFVISGYLITSILAADLDRGTYSIATFYERRARRILPALFFVIAVSLPMAWRWLTPEDLKDFGQSIVGVTLFSSNVLFWRESGYFATAAELKPLLHTWSLAVEEQFYLFFPLLLALVWKVARARVLAVLLVLGALSLALASYGVSQWPSATFFLLPARAWELSVGAVVALVAQSGQRDTRASLGAELLAVLGVALIAGSMAMYRADTPFPGLAALPPTIGTALVIRYAQEGTWVARLLSLPPLVRVGLISYSAYLWHQPLFAFARHATVDALSTAALLGLSVLSLVLAYVTWRFVEAPFRDRSRVTRDSVFRFALVGSGAMFLVGLSAHVTSGFARVRVSEAQRAVLATAVPSPERDRCHTIGADYLKPSAACNHFVDRPSWALIGDSHGVEPAHALGRILEPVGDGVKHLTFSHCRPSSGRYADQGDCGRWTAEAMALVLGDSSIRHVVLAYRLNMHLFGEHEFVYPGLPDEGNAATRDSIWRSYVGMAEALVRGGKQVHLLLQVPELPKPIGILVFMHAEVLDRVPGVRTAWWDRRSAFVRERLGELPAGVHIFDPARTLCDAESCAATAPGVALYFDDDHLSVSGAQSVMRALLNDTLSARPR